MTSDVPRPRPPYLHQETTRHGTVVWYVRRKGGPRVRIREPYDTPAFWKAYREALEAKAPEPKSKAAIGTLAWLVDRYVHSAEWANDFAAATRKQRHGLMLATVKTGGHLRAKTIDRRAIQDGMDRRRATPHAANNWLKAMRGLFAWALEREHVTADPTLGVKMLAGPNDDVGFHAWTEEEVGRFEERWKVGTRERLAFDLLLYTGLRRGDAVRVGRPHLRNGVLTIATAKTGQTVSIRVLPPLAASIAAGPVGELSFIAGDKGRPMTKESFGNWFREICAAAKVPGSAHGLRKAGARRAAELGASEAELNAWYGWADGSRESATYVRTANRAKLAERLAERHDPPAPRGPVRARARKTA